MVYNIGFVQKGMTLTQADIEATVGVVVHTVAEYKVFQFRKQELKAQIESQLGFTCRNDRDTLRVLDDKEAPRHNRDAGVKALRTIQRAQKRNTHVDKSKLSLAELSDLNRLDVLAHNVKFAQRKRNKIDPKLMRKMAAVALANRGRAASVQQVAIQAAMEAIRQLLNPQGSPKPPQKTV